MNRAWHLITDGLRPDGSGNTNWHSWHSQGEAQLHYQCALILKVLSFIYGSLLKWGAQKCIEAYYETEYFYCHSWLGWFPLPLWLRTPPYCYSHQILKDPPMTSQIFPRCCRRIGWSRLRRRPGTGWGCSFSQQKQWDNGKLLYHYWLVVWNTNFIVPSFVNMYIYMYIYIYYIYIYLFTYIYMYLFIYIGHFKYFSEGVETWNHQPD